MGFKVQFTTTKPAEGTDTSTMKSLEDPLAITNLLVKHGGTREHTAEGLSTKVVYGFPTQSNWQAFYNEALPLWNSAGLTSKAATLGITYDVSVIENN